MTIRGRRAERRLREGEKRRAREENHGRRRRRREGEPERVRGSFMVAPVREEVYLRARAPAWNVVEHEPVERVLHRAPQNRPGGERRRRREKREWEKKPQTAVARVTVVVSVCESLTEPNVQLFSNGFFVVFVFVPQEEYTIPRELSSQTQN